MSLGRIIDNLFHFGVSYILCNNLHYLPNTKHQESQETSVLSSRRSYDISKTHTVNVQFLMYFHDYFFCVNHLQENIFIG